MSCRRVSSFHPCWRWHWFSGLMFVLLQNYRPYDLLKSCIINLKSLTCSFEILDSNPSYLYFLQAMKMQISGMPAEIRANRCQEYCFMRYSTLCRLVCGAHLCPALVIVSSMKFHTCLFFRKEHKSMLSYSSGIFHSYLAC